MADRHGPWQRPGYRGDDIYPPFACDDGMRAGGVNIGNTRQLVHDLLWSILGGGWDQAVSDYGGQACTGDDYARFLHDLLDARGEFGRLLLHLAAAVKTAQVKDEAKVDAHFAEAHPGEAMCDCMVIDHLAWWEDPETATPVAEQLRRCLDVLRAYDHHDRLLRRATNVWLHDGTRLDCTCTWSQVRVPLRTNVPADCPIHGTETNDG